VAGNDLLQDVINADALAPGKVRTDPAGQRAFAGQVRCFRQGRGYSPCHEFRGFVVEPGQWPPSDDIRIGASQ